MIDEILPSTFSEGPKKTKARICLYEFEARTHSMACPNHPTGKQAPDESTFAVESWEVCKAFDYLTINFP